MRNDDCPYRAALKAAPMCLKSRTNQTTRPGIDKN